MLGLLGAAEAVAAVAVRGSRGKEGLLGGRGAVMGSQNSEIRWEKVCRGWQGVGQGQGEEDGGCGWVARRLWTYSGLL